MAEHRQQDKLSKIEQIIDSDMSDKAKVILVKSLFLPANWHWQLDWILETFNLKNFSWRKVAIELKEKGFLELIHVNNKQGFVSRKLVITHRPVENQPDGDHRSVGEQPFGETPNYQEVDRHVDPPSFGKSTDILIKDKRSNSIINTPTACNNSVDFQPDGNAARHNYLSVFRENLPPVLLNYKQWVYWQAVQKAANDKPAKIPFTSPGNPAKTNDPSTWLDWKAIEANPPEKIGMTGIGFVLTKADPFVMVDLDDCVEDGNPNDYAFKVIEYFDSYTEISPSGTGIRIIIMGKLEKALKKVEIEIYSELRYMALTGHRWGEKFRGIEKRQTQLDAVIKKHGEAETPKKKVKREHGERKTNGIFRVPKETIVEGNRNNRMAYWAGIIRVKVETEQDYYNCLHAVNEKCCQPPLPESEVNAIGKSIWRYNA